MGSKYAVCAAGLIHIVLGLSLFLRQAPDVCSPAPQLASYIFAGTILVMAGRIPLFSEGYSHLPNLIQFLVETLGTLAILEFFDIYVWCRVERFVYHLVKILFAVSGMDAKTYLEQEYYLLVAPTTALVACVVYIVSQANLLKCRSLLRPRINIHLNRELYMEMIAGNLSRNNNWNRRLNHRIH